MLLCFSSSGWEGRGSGKYIQLQHRERRRTQEKIVRMSTVNMNRRFNIWSKNTQGFVVHRFDERYGAEMRNYFSLLVWKRKLYYPCEHWQISCFAKWILCHMNLLNPIASVFVCLRLHVLCVMSIPLWWISSALRFTPVSLLCLLQRVQNVPPEVSQLLLRCRQCHRHEQVRSAFVSTLFFLSISVSRLRVVW